MSNANEPATTEPSTEAPEPPKPPWRSIWSHFSGVAARNRTAAAPSPPR
jgi:hypothetical protein